MNFIETNLEGCFIIEPRVIYDERGYFVESFNERTFQERVGESIHFVQDNQSFSSKGVLRGLHYQLPPKAQGKLVRVIQGEVFDVVVDIRCSSPTFGKWVGEILSGDNKKQIWIPKGFAHGFVTLSDTSEFLYKTTDLYSPEYEACILWNDKTINIKWPFDFEPVLSKKDIEGKSFTEAVYFK
jgi:dTDP-4-dehydrorhamnose 3,5-epimerase